jgi:type VI secretion system secreted protein VgrG
VQYRESHFAFVSRLMEQEGIFYFFEHTEDRHVLVLADHNSSMPLQPVPTAHLTSKKASHEEVITTFLDGSARHVGRTTLRDWDPLQPFFDLETSIAGDGHLEYYDYPAGYSDLEVGDHYARMRQESGEAASRMIRGAGRIRSFESGRRFELTGHYRPDLNREFVLTQVQHQCRAGGFRSDEKACIPGDVPFRPRQVTPGPTVRGPHTAIVVGQPGEDVRTDEHGRVEIRFHWDRRDASGDAGSCMVRVASFWAGKGWGALHLPRPGHEVVVDFLEGNPDRPLITGSVYNDANRPAWTLPGHANISGIRSRSSPDGTADHYNEIVLDDTKGKERVAIHAERSFHLSTEASEYRRIGSNSVTLVRGARAAMVEGTVDLTFDVELEGMEPIPYQSPVGDYLGVLNDRVVEVGKVMRYIAGEGHSTELLEGANHHTLLREGDHTIAFAGPGSQRIEVLEGEQVINVFEGDQKILLNDGDHVVEARGRILLKASGPWPGAVVLDAENAVLVTAGNSITIKVGETELKLTEEGVFINNAPLIELNALIKATTSAPIVEVAATMQATVTADVMAEVSATGLVNVRGGGVVIN